MKKWLGSLLNEESVNIVIVSINSRYFRRESYLRILVERELHLCTFER